MQTRRGFALLTIAGSLALAAGTAHATDWKVQFLNPTAGQLFGEVDFALIQDAIDDANVLDGDTLLVYGPGLALDQADPSQPYPELLDLGGKNLNIVGTHNTERIRIMPLLPDPGSLPLQVVAITGGQNSTTRLVNFSIETPQVDIGGQLVTPPVRGLHLSGSSPQIVGCQFIDLLADHGAGVLVELEASPLIKGCEFDNCDAFAEPTEIGLFTISGGGIYIDTSYPTIEDTLFTVCDAPMSGGAVHITGDSGVMIRGTVFDQNSTSGSGGGIYTEHSEFGVLDVIKTEFVDNSAMISGGAAALLADGPTTFVSCNMEDNIADNGGVGLPTTGGAVFHSVIDAGEPSFPPDSLAVCSIINTRLVGNEAEIGAALAASHPSAVTTMVNTTAADNTAGTLHAAVFNLAHLSVENSVVYWNTPSPWVENFVGLPVSFYSDLEGYIPNTGDIACIDEDPFFRNIAARDVRLETWSGCIDEGDNSRVPTDDYDIDGDSDFGEALPHDLDELPRFVSTDGADVVDMGCYEVQSEGPCNPADLAPMYGVLDLNDITAFIAAFTAGDMLADLTGDGILDLADVNAFVFHFMSGCP